MKNFVLAVLAGIIVFLLLTIMYQNRKDLIEDIKGLGSVGTASARERAALKADRIGKQDISIGFIYPFINCEKGLRDGVRLACREINEKGILGGRRIKLVEMDSGENVTDFKISLQHLIEELNIVAVIGGTSYINFVSASPICEFNGVILMSPVLSSGILPETESFNMVFANYPPIKKVITAMYSILDKKDLKSSVIISPSEFQPGYHFANAFDSYMSRTPTGEKGILYREIIHPNSPPSLIQNALDICSSFGVFDSLLACGDLELVQDVIRHAGKLEKKPVCFLSGEMEIDGIAQFPECKDIEVYLPSTYDPDLDKPAVEGFKKNFQAEFNRAPDVWAAQGYDTLKVIASAIVLAESSNPTAIAEALFILKYEDNVSVAPHISFSDKGELSSGNLIMKYPEDGVFKVLR